MDNWYNEFDTLFEFAQVLIDTGEFDNATALQYFYEKPHKWNVEYKKWVALGRPKENEDGWEDFCGFLENEREA